MGNIDETNGRPPSSDEEDDDESNADHDTPTTTAASSSTTATASATDTDGSGTEDVCNVPSRPPENMSGDGPSGTATTTHDRRGSNPDEEQDNKETKTTTPSAPPPMDPGPSQRGQKRRRRRQRNSNAYRDNRAKKTRKRRKSNSAAADDRENGDVFQIVMDVGQKGRTDSPTTRALVQSLVPSTNGPVRGTPPNRSTTDNTEIRQHSSGGGRNSDRSQGRARGIGASIPDVIVVEDAPPATVHPARRRSQQRKSTRKTAGRRPMHYE